MGIDGYSFFNGHPIQVKRSERVGRKVVDEFETAIERSGHDTGFIVAFSFTRGAVEEVARVRRQGKMSIALVKVADVLEVGELIDTAAKEGRPVDMGKITPNLLGLFSELQEKAQKPGKKRAPRKRGAPQQQLPDVG